MLFKGAFVLGENDFKKSFSPKPRCLVATVNFIFRKMASCWPKFSPLTRKWFYTLIFTSNHIRRERERERESPDRRAPIVDRRVAQSTSGAIVQQARSTIAPLVNRDLATIEIAPSSPSSGFVWICLFLVLLQTPENIFQKFFWNATKYMKTFFFPKNSIFRKWNIFRKYFYTNQTQPKLWKCEFEIND